MTDSIAACQKWATSHFLRMSITSDIYLEYAFTGSEDITNDLRHYNIKKYNDSLKRIMAMVKNTLNPFDEKINKEKLNNLGTGKAVSSNTEEFMLGVKTNRENLRKNFIKECVEDPSMLKDMSRKKNFILLQQNLGRK